MSDKRIGLIIIGDEILSGRRTDKHLSNLTALLTKRGMTLDWVKIIGDDEHLLNETLEQSFATNDVVFSTGGIGMTPDDLTRQAAANATGVSIARHPEGAALLEDLAKKRNITLTDQQYHLVHFPAGAELIPNAVNGIPGFSVNHHHFVPGFPDMAQCMMEWVLDNRYQDLHTANYRELSLIVYGISEHLLAPIMDAVMSKHASVKVFCLPGMEADQPRNEMGVKGKLPDVENALQLLKNQLTMNSYRWKSHDQ